MRKVSLHMAFVQGHYRFSKAEGLGLDSIIGEKSSSVYQLLPSEDCIMSSLQPNSRFCFVCGLENPYGLHIRFRTLVPGEVTAEVTIPQHFQGYPGVVHGGIIAAMLDEVAGRSLMGGDPPRFMLTVRLDVRYRRKVPVGQPIRLVGKVAKNRGHSAVAIGQIFDLDGNLLAEAEVVLVDLPQEVVQSADLEQLGWRVYEE